MKRIEIERLMKSRGQKTIDLVYNEDDQLGVYCELKGGYLCDYTGHRVNRNVNVWGYLDFQYRGKRYREPTRVKFDEPL